MNRNRGMSPKTITTLALMALTGYFLLRMIIPFLQPILWAITIAIFVFPLQRYIDHKIPNKNLAALIGTVTTVGVVIAPAIIISVQMGYELKSLYDRLNNWGGLTRIVQWLQSGSFNTWLQTKFGITALTLQERLSGRLEALSNAAVRTATGIVQDSVTIFIDIFFIIFTLFFLLRDGDRFLHWILHLLPLPETRRIQLIARVRDVINATIIGNLTVASTQGVVAGIMFYILGIPGTFLWTLIMIVLAMIPLMGSFIIWLPAAVWLLLSGKIVKGIVLILWGVLVVGVIDNFMRPLLVGSRTKLHTMAIFYAVLGGIKFFGPIGLVLGPMTVAVFITLLEFLQPDDDNGISP